MTYEAGRKQTGFGLKCSGLLLSTFLCFQLAIPKIAFAKPGGSSPGSRESVSELVSEFLAALKAGDVAALKDHVGGELSVRMRPLLNQNKHYPEFLRNHYADVKFSIDDIVFTRERAVATVKSRFPGEAKEMLILEMRQDANGSWKITSQTLAR